MTGIDARNGREQRRETEDPLTGLQGVVVDEEYRASTGDAEENVDKGKRNGKVDIVSA